MIWKLIEIYKRNPFLISFSMPPTNVLPDLNRIIWAALKTAFRKPVADADVNLEMCFAPTRVSPSTVESFRKSIGFPTEAIPVPYLYLLVQRAQVGMMLDSTFPLPIPGMIHLSNNLQQFASWDWELPVEAKVKVHIPGKKEGSLFPVFQVSLFQDGKVFCKCESTYLRKRKRKQGSPKPVSSTRSAPETRPMGASLYEKQWHISPQDIDRYAEISGDRNPIHTHNWAARLLGFPRRVMHGWYTASRAIACCELYGEMSIAKFEVHFHHPVIPPCTLDWKANKQVFEVWKGDTLCISGSIG